MDQGAVSRLTRDTTPRTSPGTPALADPAPLMLAAPEWEGAAGASAPAQPAPRPSPGSEEGLRPPLAARRRLTWGRTW